VKKPATTQRASHVNEGTAVAREDLAWPKDGGPVLQMPKLHAEIEPRAVETRYGGLALVEQFCRNFRVAQEINERVHVLKVHLPYSESDHVLAQALNFYVGGRCLEDMASLQHDEAVCRLLGACRLPDPTTAGDFLRRFNTGALTGLRQAADAVQHKVWKKLARRHGRHRTKRALAVVHMDGHLKALYGDRFEGADFSYKGEFSFNALALTLAGSGECLAARLRPGNVRSSNGAAELLDEHLPRLKEHFEDVLVVADSDFDRSDVREACQRSGAYFAFVGRDDPARSRLADTITQWNPFLPRAKREAARRREREGYRPRARQPNRRRQRARERGYTDLRLVKQYIGEVDWTPPDRNETLRLVVRRQILDRYEGKQGRLTDFIRDRYVVTNLPKSWSVADVIDQTYLRCDQENVIEQLGSGLAMWRTPVKEFVGNEAWLEIARLGWNLRAWIAQLQLPDEVVRWEWKRFRQAFVFLAAQVIHRARQVWLRFAGSHRFVHTLVAALVGSSP
jgi:Transposase DDE domain group 1